MAASIDKLANIIHKARKSLKESTLFNGFSQISTEDVEDWKETEDELSEATTTTYEDTESSDTETNNNIIKGADAKNSQDGHQADRSPDSRDDSDNKASSTVTKDEKAVRSDNESDKLFQKMPLQVQPHRIHKNLKSKQYECPYCSFTSLYYSATSNHTLIHTGERPYKCHMCDYTARQRGHIVIHMRVHSGKKPFKCTKCNYSTNQRNHLRIHTQVHSQERPFECPGCTYRSKNLSVMQMHIKKSKHDHTFRCDECDYATSRKHNLIQHALTHSGSKPFKCDMCPYQSSQKGHLNVHIRTHTREKPFKCSKCPFASTVPKSLREHMKMHKGRRSHRCPHCSFSTSQSFSLKRHVLLHTTQSKTLRCKYCSFTSGVKKDYLQHFAIHATSKAYFCDLCHFTTPFKYQYTTHMMTHVGKGNAGGDADKNLPNNGECKRAKKPHEVVSIKGKSGRKTNAAKPLVTLNRQDKKLLKKTPTKKSFTESEIGHTKQNGTLENPLKHSGKKKQIWNTKNGSKMKINIGSLIPMSAKKSPILNNNAKHSRTRAKTGVTSRSVTPICQDATEDLSSRRKTTSENSPARKKSKRSFVCLYCETEFCHQEIWIRHELRHFKGWPEIV